jgi:hypothetical protein
MQRSLTSGTAWIQTSSGVSSFPYLDLLIGNIIRRACSVGPEEALRAVRKGYVSPVRSVAAVFGAKAVDNDFHPFRDGILRHTATEKITRQEALRIATNNNAFDLGREGQGLYRDGEARRFRDPFRRFHDVPEDDFLKLHPLATYVPGRNVLSAPEANGNF